MAAAVAARTSRIGIGYAVNIAPFHNPRRLAEDIALVDHLSGGRVVAGFGSGYSAFEYGLVGADFESRSATSRRVLDEVLAHWTDAAASVPCCQQPHPPVVVACRSEAAIRAVAASGHGVLLLGGLERIVRGAAAYRDVAGESGYVGAMRHVFVVPESGVPGSVAAALGRPDGAALDTGPPGTPGVGAPGAGAPAADAPAAGVPAVVRDATRWTLSRLRAFAGDAAPVGRHDLEDYLQERAAVGAAQVRRDLRHLRDAGVDELLCWMRWGDLPTDAVHASMRAFADLFHT